MMEMPQMPKLYTELPQIKEVEKEIADLNAKTDHSYAWKNDWRAKESMTKRVEYLKKRLAIIIDEEHLKYEKAMKKYEEDMAVYEKNLQDRKDKLAHPIKSLEVEEE